MTRPYIFHRGNMFYAVELRDDADALANVKCNPGTTKVETLFGRVIWEAPPSVDSEPKGAS